MDEDTITEMTVTLETICAIARGAHDLMGKSAASTDDPDEDDPETDVLEDRGHDAIEAELRHLIDDLDHDAQIDLVTVMWLGRDESEDWDSLRAIAVDEHTDFTSEYLLGTPRLADYLLAGLDRLGLSCDGAGWENP